MSMRDAITLAALAELPAWVAWQTQTRDGKPTKLPYSPSGLMAKADDPKTWGTRTQAEERAASLPKPCGSGGIGLELTQMNDGRNHGGIDLDSCRDPDTGVIEPWAIDVISRFASYTEVSPSKTGVKVFFTYETEDLPTLRTAMDGSAWGKMFKRNADGDHPPAIEVHLALLWQFKGTF